MFVLGLLVPGSSRVLIGLGDADEEGTYTWSDGSPFQYDSWGNRQPDDFQGTRDCVVAERPNGLWDDIRCIDGRVSYMCEIEFKPAEVCPDPNPSTGRLQTMLIVYQNLNFVLSDLLRKFFKKRHDSLNTPHFLIFSVFHGSGAQLVEIFIDS